LNKKDGVIRSGEHVSAAEYAARRTGSPVRVAGYIMYFLDQFAIGSVTTFFQIPVIGLE
jgi:hypothetical protein